MRGASRGSELYSLGNQELILSETKIRRGYFYQAKRSGKQTEQSIHYLFVIDVSKKLTNNLDKVKQTINWGISFLAKKTECYVSIVLFSRKNEIKWLIYQQNARDLTTQLEAINQLMEQSISTSSNSSLVNMLECILPSLISSPLVVNQHQFIILSSGMFRLIEYEVDLKQERFSKIKTIIKSHQIRIDILSLDEFVPISFKQWIQSFNSKVQLYECVNSRDILFYFKKILQNRRVALRMNEGEVFLCRSRVMIKVTQPSDISVLEDELIISFDVPFSSTQECQEERVLNQELIRQFLKQYAIYLIRIDSILQASHLLFQNGLIREADYIKERYTQNERRESIKYLTSVHHKEVEIKKQSSISLFTLLEWMTSNEECQLLWSRNQMYERVTLPRQTVDEAFEFHASMTEFYKVLDVVTGEKKLNVSLNVKIGGEVEELKTGLKLDAYVLKTFTILLEGDLKVDELYCLLSDDVKKRCQSFKLIKRILRGLTQEVCVIDLKKILVTNTDDYATLTQDQVGEMIYEIERLKCWQIVLKEMSRNQWKSNKMLKEKLTSKQELKQKIKKKYHISDSGLYRPRLGLETQCETDFYLARVVEWKVESFNKEEQRRNAFEHVMNRVSKEGLSLEEILLDELTNVTKKCNQLKQRLHFIRIMLALRNIEFFDWDRKWVSSKSQVNPTMSINTVLRGEMRAAMKQLSCVMIRENAYTVLVRCPVSVVGVPSC